MGGDGTFREVASGLLDSGRADAVAMGMLPTGTANDQGRSFGLDAGDAALESNLGVVAAGKETRLDAGRLEVAGREPAWFFDSAGWGVSARVLRARNDDRAFIDRHLPELKAIYRDQLVYAGALARVFLESYVVDDTFSVEVETGGERVVLEGLTDLVIKATRVYAGAWVLDRTSRHDDGLFEVVPFRGKLDWTSKAIVDLDGNPITEEMLNRIGVEHSRPFRIAKARFHLAFPAGGAEPAAQLDGEEWDFHGAGAARGEDVTIEVVPRAIRLVVP
jgi:diacylglycerol kinase family enzyme